MADVYEQNLAQKSLVTADDYVRVVGTDNVSYKQQIATMPSQFKVVSGTDLLGYIKSIGIGTYFVRMDNVSGFPVGGGVVYRIVKTHGINDARCSIIAIPMDATASIYTTFITSASASSISWVAQPTRAEIDALNTATATYTPTFSWSDGTTPTVANAQFSYTKIGKLCWLSGRFQITSKGSVGNSASLLISLPSGIGARGLTPSSIGTFTPNTFTEPPLFIVRVDNSTKISIAWGAGGGYSSPKISAQYYTVFAVVPLD